MPGLLIDWRRRGCHIPGIAHATLRWRLHTYTGVGDTWGTVYLETGGFREAFLGSLVVFMIPIGFSRFHRDSTYFRLSAGRVSLTVFDFLKYYMSTGVTVTSAPHM